MVEAKIGNVVRTNGVALLPAPIIESIKLMYNHG